MLVVSCHERKLAKHVKGVRKKKTRRDKERTFHRLSSSIQALLLSSHVLHSFLLYDLQEMKNTKEKEEEQLT